MEFIPVMEKMHFQQSLLQSSVSHDPSEKLFSSSMLETTFFMNIKCKRKAWTLLGKKKKKGQAKRG